MGGGRKAKQTPRTRIRVFIFPSLNAVVSSRLTAMKPQFLPEAWKVDYNHFLSYGEHTKLLDNKEDDEKKLPENIDL